jgi:hypothetical protein
MILHPKKVECVVEKSGFSDEQIAFALNQSGQGMKVEKVCRKRCKSDSKGDFCPMPNKRF